MDSEFFKSILFSGKNGNERKTFDINIFDTRFKEKFKIFVKKNID